MAKGEKIKKGLKNIGWLVAFPVPVTKALTKKQGGKFGKKAATIAATWALYLGIATAGVSASANRWIQSAKEKQAVEAAAEEGGNVTDHEEETYWITLEPGEQYQISTKMIDSGEHVTYYVSKPEYATVDKNGLVTAIKYGGECVISIYSDDGDVDYVVVAVAKHRETKLSIKVVEEGGYFSKEDWNASFMINGHDVENGQYYDVWQDSNLKFNAVIQSRETLLDSGEGKAVIVPGAHEIVDGFQVMVPVSVTEHYSDGSEKVTNFQVFFHFDGNTFTAANKLIFGKMSSKTLEIRDAYEFDFLYFGDTFQANVMTYPYGQTPVYISGDESIVTIDENGKGTAVGFGETCIIAYSEETGEWGYARVYVGKSFYNEID